MEYKKNKKTIIILLKVFFFINKKSFFFINKSKINIINKTKGAIALTDVKIFLKFISFFKDKMLSKLVSMHNQIAKNKYIYISLFIN